MEPVLLSLDAAIAEIDASPAGPQIAAFFDFDGTLIHGYSALLFAQDRLRRGEVGAAEFLRSARVGLGYLIGKAGHEDLIRLAGTTWQGSTVGEIEALGRRVFRDYVADKIYPEARALVAAHRRRGHTIAITTSATWFQVAPIAAVLGIDDVVCQHLAVEDGRLTGEQDGPSLWGPGKAAAAHRYGADHGIDLAQSWFYADGDEDAALMREIGRPRPTNPGRRLEAEAEAEQWPILRFASRGTPGVDVLARNLGGMLAAAPVASSAAAVGLWHRSRRATANLATTLLPDVMLGIAAVSLDVVGTAHLDTARPAVVVCNQRSRVDVLVLARLFRNNCTFVVDRSLAADPVIGTLGRLLDIEFARVVDDLDARRMARLAERLAEGNSVVFVVGDTERPGTVGPLRSTPFRLAANTDVPVLPVVLHDSERLVTRRPPVVRPGTMHVSVLAPRPVPNLRSADLAARETAGRMQAELDGARSVRDAVL